MIIIQWSALSVSFHYFTDYQQYLDKAAEEGVVDTQWSIISVAGTGKTAFPNPFLLNDPVLIHDSTPILHTMDVCIMDKESSSTKNSTQTDDKEESSDEEETTVSDNEEDVPVKIKEMSQHTILADSSDEHLSKKDDFLKHLAETAVNTLAKEVSHCPDRLDKAREGRTMYFVYYSACFS